MSISFKNASNLQKINHILGQEIDYFTQNPDLQQVEGVFRVQGTENIINPIFAKMMNDPSEVSLLTVAEFHNDPHETIGVLKKSVKQKIEVSEEAKPIILQLFEDDSNLTLTDLVVKLNQAKAFEEAKLIHNLAHLGYLIAQHGEVNKMVPSNVGLIVGAMLDNLFGDLTPATDNPLLAFKRQEPVVKRLTQTLTQAVNNKNEASPVISKPFNATYPNEAQQLEEQYRKGFKEPAVKPTAKEGIIKDAKPPSKNIFVRFFQAIARIFGFSKPKTPPQQPIISAPTNFRKETKEFEAQADDKGNENVAPHLVERKKAVAHHHRHHRNKAEEALESKTKEVISEIKQKQKPKSDPK